MIGLLLLPVADTVTKESRHCFLICILPMLNTVGLVLGKILYKTSGGSSLP